MSAAPPLMGPEASSHIATAHTAGPRRRDKAAQFGVFALPLLLWSMVVLFGSAPLRQTESALRDFAVRRFGPQINTYLESVSRNRPPVPPRLVVDPNILVRLEIQINQLTPVAQDEPLDGSRSRLAPIDVDPRFRWSNFVVGTITALIISTGLYAVVRRWAKEPSHRAGSMLPSLQSPSPSGEPRSASHEELAYARTILRWDADNARARAAELNALAWTMLIVGVLVAIFGAAILFILVPAPTPGNTLTMVLAETIRPAGIALFIEAVAWYLLRQHRILMEESRVFTGIASRRTSQDALMESLLTRGAGGFDLAPMFMAILREDFSDRLGPGESTVTVAAGAADAVPPLARVLAPIVERAPKTAS